MRHTCSDCFTSVTIPEEWLESGEDRRIRCRVCGKRVLLPIEKFFRKKKTDIKTPSGTVIIDPEKKKQVLTRIRIIIANRVTQATLMVKELRFGNHYVVGRNANRIKEVFPDALPILIPPKSDPAVSRAHLAIDLKKGGEGGILIKDLKSTNSTFISKREGGWEQLQEGEQIFLGSADRIRIGAHTQIRFDQVD